jgi:hypothetical protein
VAADAVAALEAVDGKTFVKEDLERSQSGSSGADQAVIHARSVDVHVRESES